MNDTISVVGLKKKIEDFYIIDVRENDEYKQDHIDGAINIPLGRLIRDESKGIIPRDKAIVVHCKSGFRGSIALDFLKKRGYSVKNLEGGFDAWCGKA